MCFKNAYQRERGIKMFRIWYKSSLFFLSILSFSNLQFNQDSSDVCSLFRWYGIVILWVTLFGWFSVIMETVLIANDESSRREASRVSKTMPEVQKHYDTDEEDDLV